MRLVIASRKSDLARIQALQVGQELQKKNPHLKIEYHWRESLGDINLNDPLWKMPEKGVFTEDFFKGLLSGEFDLVVHSWKDLPIEDRQGTAVVATLPREDLRDVLLFKKKHLSQKKISILTSSPRRSYNLGKHLLEFLPAGFTHVDFQPVRGNVQTRVRKMLEGEASGLIVAKAALDRLLSGSLSDEFLETQSFLKKSLAELQWMILPMTVNPPAAAQGALAIEIRKDRDDLQQILQSIHCKDTFDAVSLERKMLRQWGGGCHQKIGVGVLHRPYGQVICAQGQRDSGETINLFQLDAADGAPLQGQSHFPQSPKSALWFDRVRTPAGEEFKHYNAHWISKAEALPEDVSFTTDNLLWTSGVKTWKTLAKRGLWVNGSSESLGERDDMRIQPLDQKNRQWCKWTHEGGEENDLMPLIKTYRLLPKAQQPVLSPDTKHYFWMSGSSFREALKSYPWLVDKTHWSGPGLTAEALRHEIKTRKGTGTVRIALSFEQWQKRFQS